jgi:parallel beta-helix repeat protein
MDKNQVPDSDRGALTEGASRQFPKNTGHSRRAFFAGTALASLGTSGLLAPSYKAARADLSTIASTQGQLDLRQPVVNVRDFGATGDGVTDDTTKIQSAIESLAGRTGTVFFPAGIYLISQNPKSNIGECLLLRSNIDYLGEGPVSKLLLRPTPQIYVQMMRAEVSRQITIRRLHFDGNRARQPANQQHYAIYLGAVEDCRVQGCLFHDMAGDGIFVNEGHVQGTSQRVVVEDNELYGGFSYAIHLRATSNSIVHSNFVHDTTGWALLNDISGGMGNEFIGNRICRALGFNISAGARNGLIADNVFSMVAEPIGIVDASTFEIVRNNCWQTEGSAIVVGNSQDITIKDNSIRESTFTEKWNAAISVDLTGSAPRSERIMVESNEISNNAMKGCVFANTFHSVVKDNLIANCYVPPNSPIPEFGYGLDMIASNTTVTGNTIIGNDVGIVVENGSANNRFLENKILKNAHGGILIVPGAGSHNDFHSNRIQGNTPFGLWNQSTAQVDARGNFWGCTAGPNNPGCDTVKGSNVSV